MDRGVWWATVHGVAESDMTKQLTHRHIAQARPLVKHRAKILTVRTLLL